eukprot:1663699-Alexandrium_andersonii.AAC.1
MWLSLHQHQGATDAQRACAFANATPALQQHLGNACQRVTANPRNTQLQNTGAAPPLPIRDEASALVH